MTNERKVVETEVRKSDDSPPPSIQSQIAAAPQEHLVRQGSSGSRSTSQD